MNKVDKKELLAWANGEFVKLKELDSTVFCKYLKGKTIKKVIHAGYEKYDGKPFLILYMSDGSICRLMSYYGSYTGNSPDEYPEYISMGVIKDKPTQKKEKVIKVSKLVESLGILEAIAKLEGLASDDFNKGILHTTKSLRRLLKLPKNGN